MNTARIALTGHLNFMLKKELGDKISIKCQLKDIAPKRNFEISYL